MIKTKRLVIKSLTADNDGQVAKLVSDSQLLASAHLTFSTYPVTSFELNLFLQSVHVYGIYQQQLIGLLLLDWVADADPPALELGYLLCRQMWGKGIMTEAVAGLLQTVHAPIIATTDDNNYRSQHVLQKNGFTIASHATGQIVWHKSACTVC